MSDTATLTPATDAAPASETLRAALRNRISEARAALPAALQAPIPGLSPDGWPKAVEKSIREHNARIAKPVKTFEAMLASVDSLADAAADPAVSAADVIALGTQTRVDFLEYLRTLQAAIVGAVALFEDLTPVADGVVADAEAALEKAKDDTAKKLKKAGVTVETMQAWPANPSAAERQFSVGHVGRAEAVIAATRELADAKARRDHVRSQRSQQRHNAALVGDTITSHIAGLVGLMPAVT